MIFLWFVAINVSCCVLKGRRINKSAVVFCNELIGKKKARLRIACFLFEMNKSAVLFYRVFNLHHGTDIFQHNPGGDGGANHTGNVRPHGMHE